MKIKKILVLLLAIFISFSLAKENVKVDDNEPEPTRLESFTKLQKVISAVEMYYVDDVHLDKIVNKAIAGLMSELDAHSAFMDKKAYKNMKVSMKGEFGGLGIVIGVRDGVLTIISPIDDTPAQRAGVESGDIILKINDKSTLKMTIDEAVTIMRGKPGTPIDITVVRKGENKPIKIDIIRGIIKVKSVSAKTIGDDILYLRVASFDNNVAEHLTKFIKEYKKKTKGIVLDLRNNPGGSLNQSIKAVDIFVDNGVIVSQKGKTKADDSSYTATKSATLTKVPMVVLVNGGSASASEIVSGALQDAKRAVVIGEDTFGKGSVQMLLPITDDGKEAIKITIAKYYLPSGRTIQAKGIVPDIYSYKGSAPSAKDDDFSIKEKDLKKHLEVELEKVDGKKEKKTKKPEEDKKVITKEDIYKDNQLKTGVDVLKALILTSK
ncbi:MAG: S41 family peptidase [Arcobacteraceae bacterium]|nr:S41 family peptidase [Arcobacteraceae bacterium]